MNPEGYINIRKIEKKKTFYCVYLWQLLHMNKEFCILYFKIPFMIFVKKILVARQNSNTIFVNTDILVNRHSSNDQLVLF